MSVTSFQRQRREAEDKAAVKKVKDLPVNAIKAAVKKVKDLPVNAIKAAVKKVKGGKK